nr:MAG TPA: hypothetical protein [Caudoviricetes sp.]
MDNLFFGIFINDYTRLSMICVNLRSKHLNINYYGY